MPQDGEHVYFLSADRQRLVRVATISRSRTASSARPTARSLFVADIGAGKTYRYDIETDGSLTNKTLVSSTAPMA